MKRIQYVLELHMQVEVQLLVTAVFCHFYSVVIRFFAGKLIKHIHEQSQLRYVFDGAK